MTPKFALGGLALQPKIRQSAMHAVEGFRGLGLHSFRFVNSRARPAESLSPLVIVDVSDNRNRELQPGTISSSARSKMTP